MSPSVPFNPLDKRNLAESVALAALDHDARPLTLANTEDVAGEGVYLIYYCGPFEAYARLRLVNSPTVLTMPIYVGKALHAGGRKGIEDTTAGDPAGAPLRKRLREHLKSIEAAQNLDAADFFFRHLSVDNTFVALGENGLINKFVPLWNALIDGFGNHAPGGNRGTSIRSRWDTLHPGRSWARDLQDRSETAQTIADDASEYLRARIASPIRGVDVQGAPVELTVEVESAGLRPDDSGSLPTGV